MTAGTYTDQTVTNMPGLSSNIWLVRQADEFYLYYPHLKGFNFDEPLRIQLFVERIRKTDWPARKMKDDVMEISNYDELKDFSQWVNGGYTRLKGILTADIEVRFVHPITGDMMQDKRWTPNGDGTHARVCGSCGFKETANCHYTETVTEPTCTEEGYTTCVCDDCGITYKDNFVDPIGHDWSDWADDGNGESHTRTCARCGDTETEAHNYGDWVYNKDAKFFKNGTRTRACGDCGCTETEEAANTSIFARIFLTPILWVLSLIRKAVFTGSFLWYLPWLNIFPKM